MKFGELAARLALLAGSLVFSLIFLELGCRVMRSGPQGLVQWPNLVRERMSTSDARGDSCAYAYDQTVGWALPPGCTSPSYNVGLDGFRRTPAATRLPGPPVLATGWSFTNGEEVADNESWPAYLQTLVRRQVVNAGVSGFSLDQTVLRTEQITPVVKPVAIVASFTPDDVRRSELKIAWSRQKPYFAMKDGRLDLRNVPVPGHSHGPVPLPLAAQLFGWSVLMDDVAKQLGIHEGWFYDEVRAVPPGAGEQIACLLMPRLASTGVPVVVLAQYSRGHWMADTEGKNRDLRIVRKVFDCASAAGLIPFDLSEPLEPVVRSRGVDALYQTDHHSAEGNSVVAELIMKKLMQEHLLPSTEDR